ncbi:hypothetical protein [Corynebacterium sp. NML130628]|uniref:hypothetical protein n=1 Tax=Corynebacterium sp. NML130628 TaxID=1906333 RepID=UPI0015A65573
MRPQRGRVPGSSEDQAYDGLSRFQVSDTPNLCKQLHTTTSAELVDPAQIF